MDNVAVNHVVAVSSVGIFEYLWKAITKAATGVMCKWKEEIVTQ